jgi:hypothetical protein
MIDRIIPIPVMLRSAPATTWWVFRALPCCGSGGLIVAADDPV